MADATASNLLTMATAARSPRRARAAKAALALSAALVATPACAHFQSYRQCSEISEQSLSQVPSRLSETGLFADVQTEELAEGVVAFRPRFELWSDGATKRRWVFLPPSSTIDSSDMDAWQLPEGAKLWKEFTRDGVRVETRLLAKVGPAAGDWVALSYVWDAEGRDALATPGGLEDARGTPHDVPPARECMGCHGGVPSRALGFAAIQLAHDAPGDETSLERLVREHRLTEPPPRPLRVPGDVTTQEALGYLHANCAHCHNQHRPPSTGPRCFDPRRDFDLSLRVDRLEKPELTPVYRTAVGRFIRPGDPEASPLFRRFHRDGVFLARMPPVATETIDPAGLSLLRRWIQGV